MSHLEPRRLGSLAVNKTCTLYGSRRVLHSPLQQQIVVSGSRNCGSNSRATFCTELSSIDDSACFAITGTPISCAPGFVNGILINDQNCTRDQHVLRYLSIGEHLEWIEEISGVSSIQNLPKLILFPIILLNIINLS